MGRRRAAPHVSIRVVLVSTLFATALLPSRTAYACSAPSPPKPNELVKLATAIIHVRVLGACSELTGPCSPLVTAPSQSRKPSPSATPAAPGAKPYAPGWPPIATPPSPISAPPMRYEPGDGYEFRAMEVIEVLKGPPVTGRFAIRGALVLPDDYNDQSPPYTYIRRAGRRGGCFAYAYRRDGEYLLFLRETGAALTPYWSAHAPSNEQVRSTHDPWIHWVRKQSAPK